MSSAIVSFEPQNLQEGLVLAEQMAKSALIPDTLRGKPADLLIILMTARELGIGPMQALRGMSVIKGKVVMEAALAVAQVVRRREVCEFFRLVESTDQRSTYETKRVGSESVKMTFTIEQAKAAGLTGKENWRNFPAAMLRARCSMHLARATYPDLLMGIYDPDEEEHIKQSAPAEREVNPAAVPKTAADAKARLAAVVAAKAEPKPEAIEDAVVVEASPAGPEPVKGKAVLTAIKMLGDAHGIPEKEVGDWMRSHGLTKVSNLVESDILAFRTWLENINAEPPPADPDLPF